MEKVYKKGDICSFKSNSMITGQGPQASFDFELGLGEMIRMARLNDLAIAFADAKQLARIGGYEVPSITDKKWADLRFHPRYKRQFKGGRNG